MALREFESFDNVGTIGNLAKKGWGYGGVNPTINTGTGRFGTPGFYGGDQAAHIYKTLDHQSTWIVGMALMVNNMSATAPILLFYNTSLAGYQITLRQTSLFTIAARLGDYNGTVIGTGTKELKNGIYNYIECKLTIDNTVGSLQVKVNGVTDINLSGIDTQAQSTATADRIYIGNVLSFVYPDHYMDDIYICDGTGSAPFNDFLGDIRVSSLLPNGNGNSSQFVGSDGNSTDNYLLVDDVGAASATDYVGSANVGDKDTYAMANLPSASGTVHAVKPVMVATKTDAGARSIASVVRLSGTEVDSANFPLTASYEFFTDIRQTKPGGGSWDVTSVNSMEAGLKVTV